MPLLVAPTLELKLGKQPAAPKAANPTNPAKLTNVEKPISIPPSGLNYGSFLN